MKSNYTPQEKAAYSKIKEYVKDKYGVKSVDVDGKPIEGSLLPLAPEGAVVEVQVTMG